MSENNITKSIPECYQNYFNVDMQYRPSTSNARRGYNKKAFALLNAARFGFVSAIVCEHVWQLRRSKTLEFLGKLVKDGLLALAHTDRAVDRRLYVLTYAGAQFASELMRIDLPFRSAKYPITQVNQNAIMHDTILSYVLNSGLHNTLADGVSKPLWSTFLTEIEFKRIHPSTAVKNVDALVQIPSGEVAAVELEGSFKRKAQHEATLLKVRDALVCEAPLYDKLFVIPCSQRIYSDTQRFYQQLFEELPYRIDRKTKRPLVTQQEVAVLREKIVFRTKFIDDIEHTFYR